MKLSEKLKVASMMLTKLPNRGLCEIQSDLDSLRMPRG
jgi:hypothetical protein